MPNLSILQEYLMVYASTWIFPFRSSLRQFLLQCICCGLNLSLVSSFFNWFQFYLPLFQIMVMNTQQKKIKIEPVLKILHPN